MVLLDPVQTTARWTASVTFRMKPPPFQLAAIGCVTRFVFVQRTRAASMPDAGAFACAVHCRKL